MVIQTKGALTMNILNFFIDGNDVTVTDNSTKQVIATLTLDNSDNVSSINFHIDDTELTFDQLLSIQQTIIATIKDMLNYSENSSQVADCLYWQQLGFIF